MGMTAAAGRRKQKRVSWPPEAELRKVRFFLSDDAPAASSSSAQNQLQAKASSWLWHAGEIGSEGSLAPGFESLNPVYQQKAKLTQIPLIKWQCPCRWVLNPHWLVAVGGESREFEVQTKRQVGVLEAVYPRSSSIPPDPSFWPGAQDDSYDDSQTPLVPITTIEDEENSLSDTSIPKDSDIPDDLLHSGASLKYNQSFSQEENQGSATSAVPNPSANGKISFEPNPGAEPDIVAAAEAAFIAIVRSSDEGSLIDRELLVKILSDPKMIEKLVAECATLEQVIPSTGSTALSPAASAVSSPAISTVSSPATAMAVLPLSAVPKLPLSPKPAPAVSAVSSPSAVPTIRCSPKPSPALPESCSLPSIQASIEAPLPYPAMKCLPRSPEVVAHPDLHPAPVMSQAMMKPVTKSLPPADLSHYKSLVRQHGAKDWTYFKKLIQQHGDDKPKIRHADPSQYLEFQHHPENTLGRNNIELRLQGDPKSRFDKPCVFFNSPKGCKRGASCLFSHGELTERRTEKRLSLFRGITERG